MVHKLDFQMRHYASLQRLVALNITIKEQHLSYKIGSIPISCKQKSGITILHTHTTHTTLLLFLLYQLLKAGVMFMSKGPE